MSVQKEETVAVFRRRLTELIERSGQSRARFAARAGLDRSTLSQLLSDQNVRLPRAETIARIAARHAASVDWLLGLSESAGITPDILTQPMVALGADDPAGEHLRNWLEEARGSKIRYVPSSLPDQMKNETTIHYEYGKLSRTEAEAMSRASRTRIEHARQMASEIEVCTPRQTLESLARGEGLWRQFPLRERRRQLAHMAELADAFYPSYRWFLFDARECYAAPYTIFGQKRAALYLGAMFFVFTSTEHIRELTAHFENLIRHARVQPNEIAPFIKALLKDTQ
ncbi:MAG: transcriptional regulator [Alphaproteobacteria bacterium]|nr:transcriptional regulator [Alphaproteobacteria bacterium]